MINVLIVDDEPSNLYGLARNIDWEALGYGAPALFESGEEALEELGSASFDVLISDVAMPGMTGIELVEQAKLLNPQLQVLMISGYSEFEFVQDAIHVGAQAYVLKPLKPDEVSTRLTSFRTTIEKMRHVVEQTTELEKKLTGSMKLVKERFVSDLIADMPLTNELIVSWSGLLELPDIVEGYQAIVFGLDSFGTAGREAKERMLLGNSFRQTVEVALSDMESVYIAQTNPEELVAIQLNPTSEERVRLEKQLAFVQSMMGDRFGAKVTIGCSRLADRWEDCVLVYKEIKFAMAKSRLVEDGQIVRYNGGDASEFKDYRLREELIPNIVRLMEEGDAAKVGGYMNRILDVVLSQEPVSYSYVQAFGMSFLSELIRTLKWNNAPEGDTNILMWRRMLDCGSTGQIVELLVEYVDRYMQVEKKDRLQQQHHLIRMVADFIEERLQENWTVKQLAEQFDLNASYLSVLFKREMGKTISEFVQATRIQMAIKLLQDPNIKMYEVADRVGIQTKAYFTYLFKKIVGCTPQEYRNYGYKTDDC
ncbi:response regulator [Bacillus sp. FJAT-26390]|uniref:response regulator transcription factor n=1 Tax=Bacillus sp. FJAT-26390 TaxID=1743142 RepID=UPI000808132E|nr:response regulator [Bacillus sp. FJAT-26390]OBZ15809.1 hypothetical protein A7975_30665 [Bacillus sp. FJAT-26390]